MDGFRDYDRWKLASPEDAADERERQRLWVPVGALVLGDVMNWAEMPIMKRTAKAISDRGGIPVKMLLAEDGPNRLAVIVSHDPSGIGGIREFHASISASTAGIRRQPTPAEIVAVGDRLRLKQFTQDWGPDRQVAHLWSPL